jgi:hypothetical protein
MVTGERWDPANRKRKLPSSSVSADAYKQEVAKSRKDPGRIAEEGDFHQHELAEK